MLFSGVFVSTYLLINELYALSAIKSGAWPPSAWQPVKAQFFVKRGTRFLLKETEVVTILGTSLRISVVSFWQPVIAAINITPSASVVIIIFFMMKKLIVDRFLF